MNRNRYVIVFDFETDGKSPADCNIVQIAAVPIDLRNLTILSDDFLEMDVKPNELDELGRAAYIEHREDTINWHASIQNKSVNEIVDRWEKGFAEKDAWDEFGRYIKNFNKGEVGISKPFQPVKTFAAMTCQFVRDMLKSISRFHSQNATYSTLWTLRESGFFFVQIRQQV